MPYYNRISKKIFKRKYFSSSLLSPKGENVLNIFYFENALYIIEFQNKKYLKEKYLLPKRKYLKENTFP